MNLCSRLRGWCSCARPTAASRQGGHWRGAPEVRRPPVLKYGLVPTAVWNNCSGKHAGVLAAARAIGADVRIADYNALEHPVQPRIRHVVGDLTGLPAQDIPQGVDGCNIAAPRAVSRSPVLPVGTSGPSKRPLVPNGYSYSLFARAAADDEQRGDNDRSSSPTRAMARIFNATARHPAMVRPRRLLHGPDGGLPVASDRQGRRPRVGAA